MKNKFYLFIIIFCLLISFYDSPKIVIDTKSTVIESSYVRNYQEPNYESYRLTHYYTGDPMGSGKCTASGICTNKFQTNLKGWYTYKGKLVMASGYEYELWDVIEIQIDNIWYEALILDKCGACRKAKKIDIFVSGKESAIDRKVVYVK